jgi:hypothetical protein
VPGFVEKALDCENISHIEALRDKNLCSRKLTIRGCAKPCIGRNELDTVRERGSELTVFAISP